MNSPMMQFEAPMPTSPAATPSVAELLHDLEVPSARTRFSAAKALRTLSEADPGSVYPYLDAVATLLASENSFLRWDATRTVANLAAVDREGKVEALLAKILAPIPGPQMIGAATSIAAAANIALAKPYLAQRIATAILQVQSANYQTEECRHIAIGHAIESLGYFMHLLPNRAPVVAFVRAQLDNPRSATRHKAEKFLRRWG
jgi:hypothetical protein